MLKSHCYSNSAFTKMIRIVKFVAFLSCFATAYSVLVSCDGNIYLDSEKAYDYVLTNYGTNDSLTLSQLYSFLTSLDLFHVSSEMLDCSVLSYLASLNDSKVIINSTTFSRICSNIVTLLHKDGYKFYPKEKEDPYSKEVTALTNKPSDGAIWGFGFLAVTIISLCSLVGISILPLMKSAIYDKVLLYLIALAVGTLSSNALFQLIPEGFGMDSDPMTVWQSAVIIGGCYLFYLIENMLERIFNTKHSHGDVKPNSTDVIKAENFALDKAVFNNHHNSKSTDGVESSEALLHLSVDTDVPSSSESDHSAVNVLQHGTDKPRKQTHCWIFKNYKSIRTVAWMITVADGIHNFIDGLAIGASFSVSLVQGVSTSLAIFCEEFPQELGDFAILINSGMTVPQAAFYNFASACCCYLGLIVGILVGNDLTCAQWIFALAGGVFLYISLAGMLPEAQTLSSKPTLRGSPWLCLFIKNLGLSSGFAIMLLLTVYKDEITI